MAFTITTDENETYCFANISSARFSLDECLLFIRCDGETTVISLPYSNGKGRCDYNHKYPVIDEVYDENGKALGICSGCTKDEESDEYEAYLGRLQNLPRTLVTMNNK